METQEKIAVRNPARSKPRLTRNQVRSFWAAWAGWSMDGMDSFIYSLVLVPALTELLPRSGIPATTANVGYYGGLFFALFMIGYGTALIWGPIADRFGRVRTMMFSILCFSLFTLLAAFATGIWSLAVFRFMAGVGIGGEWSIGAALVSEDWPEERRTMGAALMHTGYYIGFFLARHRQHFYRQPLRVEIYVRAWRRSGALDRLDPQQCAGAGALGKQAAAARRKLDHAPRVPQAFFAAIPPPDDRELHVPDRFACRLVGRIGVRAHGHDLHRGKRGKNGRGERALASYSTALLGITTVLGALIVPFIADWLGRRATLAIFYVIMMAAIWLAFGHVFYMREHAIAWFLVCSVLLGLGGANFIVYSFWLPEQYGTECRASAFAFITNFGRFSAAGFTFMVGAGIRHFQTFGIPVAMTALAFIVGLALVPFGEETRGKSLPA